jgi:hypothetical protein
MPGRQVDPRGKGERRPDVQVRPRDTATAFRMPMVSKKFTISLVLQCKVIGDGAGGPQARRGIILDYPIVQPERQGEVGRPDESDRIALVEGSSKYSVRGAVALHL